MSEEEQAVRFDSEAEEVANESDQADSESEGEGEDLVRHTNAAGGFVEDEVEESDGDDELDPDMIDDTGASAELTAAQRREAEAAMHARDEVGRNPGGGLRSVAALFNNLLEAEERPEDADAEMEEDTVKQYKALRERSQRVSKPHISMIQQARQALPHAAPRGETPSERVLELLTAVFEGFLWYYSDKPSNDAAGENDATAQAQAPGATIASETASYYVTELQAMAKREDNSVAVNWAHMEVFEPKLNEWLREHPLRTLGLFDEVATSLGRSLFPKLLQTQLIAVRIVGMRVLDNVRTLATRQVNSLVCLEGVCIRRTDVLPRLSILFYKCLKCGFDGNGPYTSQLLKELNVAAGAANANKMSTKGITCIQCQSVNGFMLCRERALFENHQKLTIQELAQQVPAGHIPRQKCVVLLGDLVNAVRPGEEVVVTGVLETRQDVVLNTRASFPVFGLWIIANNVQLRKDLTDTLRESGSADATRDQQIIQKLSKNPHIRDKIIASMAPSIWGNLHSKTCLAMALFGGARNTSGASCHSIRGDVNVLLIGDPGMGKSQMLKFVTTVFPRTVLTTGKGASGVGLTASVKRDTTTGEWTVEGGAFVLADDGICLIDEFDKMNDQDRVSIHEAMEQQSISISKAGIITTLRARCAVIAAANPIGGCYAPCLTLPENVELSDPILSRFDLIAVLKDKVFPLADQHLADHVLQNHMQSHPRFETDLATNKASSTTLDPLNETLDDKGYPGWVSDEGRIPEKYLKMYIAYARRHITPEMKPVDEKLISNFYASLRQATYRLTGAMPVTVRHLESVFRLAAANAKMRLSKVVTNKDIHFAISTMIESFVLSQKQHIARAMSHNFAKYRVLAISPTETLTDILATIVSRSLDDKYCTSLLHEEAQETRVEIPLQELKQIAMSLHELPENYIDSWVKSAKLPSIYYVTQRKGEVVIGCKVS